MMTWDMKGNDPAILGFIHQLIPGNAPASLEIEHNYAHGGGFSPFEGFTQAPNGDLLYPEDPPTVVLAEAVNGLGEIIRFHDHAWVSITQPDGTFKVTRMD